MNKQKNINNKIHSYNIDSINSNNKKIRKYKIPEINIIPSNNKFDHIKEFSPLILS